MNDYNAIKSNSVPNSTKSQNLLLDHGDKENLVIRRPTF
jgi:hypothetical protein